MEKTQGISKFWRFIWIAYLVLTLFMVVVCAVSSYQPLGDKEIKDCEIIANNVYKHDYDNLKLEYGYIVEISLDNVTISHEYHDTKAVCSMEKDNIILDTKINYANAVKRIAMGASFGIILTTPILIFLYLVQYISNVVRKIKIKTAKSKII